MATATRHDWKREKFRKLAKIPFTDEFTPGEVKRLRRGLIPDGMEDKWFIYLEKKTLYFHRSWTGQGVYQVRLKFRRDGSAIVKWAKGSKDVRVIDKRYEAALLEFLIANLLLGENIPFPRHEKIEEEGRGVFQHAISGTGYPERPVSKKSLKQDFR